MRSALLKYIILSLLILVFSGCSRTRLVYNYLDLFLLWKIDDYITLSDEQEDRVKQQLQFLLEWHRNDQLPRYIQFVDQIQKNTQTDMTAEHFQQYFETIEAFLRDIMIQAEPDISQLLFRLDREKQNELIKNLSEKQEQLEKKYLKLNQEKYRKKRIKRTEKLLMRFIGKLTTKQKKILAGWADNMDPSRELWLENRRAWQSHFQKQLSKDKPYTCKQKELKRLLINPELFRSNEYDKVMKQNQLTIFSMLEAILLQLTEKQKYHLNKELGKIKNDLVSLLKE